jgi:hypothetical protein
MNENNKLPEAKDVPGFIGEAHEVNLTDLHDKTFLVAAATGGQDGYKFLCSTVHGPYNFTAMVEAVGLMWRTHLHHARIYILEQDATKRAKYIDGNTTDYIEANYETLITDAFLSGPLSEKLYTATASIIEAKEESETK